METLVKYAGIVMVLAAMLLTGTGEAAAQQKIGYVDSEFILGKIPEVATVDQNIDRMAQNWQAELDERRQEVDDMFREYQARELLYTKEERDRKRQDIIRVEEELERLRMKYFGPEGDLFREQDQQMRPIQERVLEAIDAVATKDGYDYIFDKSGDFLFLYAREQHDVSNKVLEELGIEVDPNNRGQGD
jgi:outer membrane protein